MLDICLKLLSILGILLLLLLGLLFVIIILVLLYPVTYRIRGRKDSEKLELSVRVKWLSGLIRVQYQYPEPGRVKLKFLCFSLYDMKIPPDKSIGGKDEKSEKKVSDASNKKQPASQAEKKAGEDADKISQVSGSVEDPGAAENENTREAFQNKGEGENICTEQAPDADSSGSEEESSEKNSKFSGKIRKIKYTIQGIYDKIKKIWENISYYTELLQEDDTKDLFAHALRVTGKILKHIRPRRVKADILFGTGSPDTTGYAYGIYCIATASLKPGFLVTPDFEQKIFQGEFDLAGHVGIGVLIVNGLRLLLDKKLHIFIRKIRKKIK